VTAEGTPSEATHAVAHTLIEALPYMRRYQGAVMVIKYGGHAMGDVAAARDFARDVVLLKQVGINPVVVHGGGPQIKAMLDRLKIRSAFVDGLRVTDGATVEVVEMVLAGKINKEIVTAIQAAGGTAVGISGKDGRLIGAKRLTRTSRDPESSIERVVDLGFVGEPDRIDTALLDIFKNTDVIPVIAPLGVGEDGQTYNINADTAAGAVAGALRARKLVMLTDVRGVLDADKHRRRRGHGRHDPEARDLPRGRGARGRGRGDPGRPGAARDPPRALHRARHRHPGPRRPAVTRPGLPSGSPPPICGACHPLGAVPCRPRPAPSSSAR
jgi:acetylglutamate kinase